MGGKPTKKCGRDEKEWEQFQPYIMYLKYLQYLTEREKLFATLIRYITWPIHFWQYVSIVVPSFWHVLPPLLSLSKLRMSSMSLPCPTKKMDLLLLHCHQVSNDVLMFFLPALLLLDCKWYFRLHANYSLPFRHLQFWKRKMLCIFLPVITPSPPFSDLTTDSKCPSH